ncbi:3'-5' exonuclease [Schleiferilactobacillus perolens]|uniref:DNA polymerase III polC-type n=1 Tax=Schleiferilactobacillus perolens DSM 12744 TaxID=1423792 RepID=A0A0R1N781_9LACO|nr:3'-5' exonuclease [Schleiferilactobacillus perolens]KRL13490.1 DNA-directed DNA polymerase III epsilon subunit [Schleiferilactobacillus perolens DSM 12744]
MNFVAMDFETANARPDSALSLALVVVRNSEITDSFYTLIKPQTKLDWRNTKIHGIHTADVADSPTFDQVWPHIAHFYTADKLVAAHNASFDSRVLRETLASYAIDVPRYLLIDTVRTSRRFYPDMKNHRLNTVAANLGFDLRQHHNALADSIACAQILLQEEAAFGDDALKKFVKLV